MRIRAAFFSLLMLAGPATGAAVQAQSAPAPIAAPAPIVIKGPAPAAPIITPAFPTPMPALPTVILRGVPVLSVPNFGSFSPAQSRAARKAKYALLPEVLLGEQSALTGTPAAIGAGLDALYAARTAESARHVQTDGRGIAVRLRGSQH